MYIQGISNTESTSHYKDKNKTNIQTNKKMTVEPTMTIQGTGHNFFKRSHSILRRIIEYIYKNKDKMQ